MFSHEGFFNIYLHQVVQGIQSFLYLTPRFDISALAMKVSLRPIITNDVRQIECARYKFSCAESIAQGRQNIEVIKNVNTTVQLKKARI